MKKLFVGLIIAMLICACSENDKDEVYTPIDPMLNLTEYVLSSDGDSIDIISGSAQDLVAMDDSLSDLYPVPMEPDTTFYVSDKIRYYIINKDWYSLTMVFSTEKQASSRIIVKVKENTTQQSRRIPLTIYSRKDTHTAEGVYNKTNFIQKASPEQ
jgi:hypothetical protein